MSEIKDGESVTAFTLRRIREEIAEECAKIAESHVDAVSFHAGETDRNLGYNEACRDIAKAIRDTYAHE